LSEASSLPKASCARAERKVRQIASVQDQKIENIEADSRSFSLEVLETIRIRVSGIVQCYDFAVDDGFGGQILDRLGGLRESFGEVFAGPRIQNGFAAGLDSDGAIAVQLVS